MPDAPPPARSLSSPRPRTRYRQLALFLSRLALLIAVPPAAAADLPPPVRLELGADWTQVMAAHPPGTAYVVATGIHRGVGIIPKDGDTISGEPGAVLNGCLQLTEWTQDGEFWVHPAPIILPDWGSDGLFCTYDICRQPQDLYADDHRLFAVESLALLRNDSQWFLDKEQSRVVVRFDPRPRDMEFGGPAMVAINCLPPGQPVPAGVVIENLKIEKYPSRPQIGTVVVAGGALLRNCDISYSHGYGVSLGGPSIVRDCYIHHNGMCGIGAGGEGSVVEGNEIAYNVWPLYAGRAWDNGGVKIANARNIVFRRNYVHHNAGPGIWTDIKTSDVLMEDNIVEHNDWEGLLPELSNHFVLRRNICRWNGVNPRPALWGGQICVQNSSYIVIEDNYMETGPGRFSRWGNPQGVMLINQNVRKIDEGNFQGGFGVREVIVRRNMHVMPLSGHNGIDYGTLGWDTYQDFLDANVVWSDNRYLVGRPLFHQWSWRLEEGWDNTLSAWLRWEDWKQHQDQNSTLETFAPETYLPTSTRQHALIKEVTGHDYPALKQALTRRPPPPIDDRDADGLPDAWEIQYFGTPTAADPLDDNDADGLDNAREFAARTSPIAADTDEDGMPDGWEVGRASDPLVADGDLDPDGNGLSAREEYEDSVIPGAGAPAVPGIPQPAISLWLSPQAGVTTGPDNTLESWQDTGPERLTATWPRPPALTGTAPSGLPLIQTSGTVVHWPGRNQLWGDESSGFTLCFVFQPSDLDVSRRWKGLLSAEEYLVSGFRLRLESGYLVWSAAQSGGTLTAEGHTRLLAGQTYIITLVYGGSGRTSALYVNGVPQMIRVAGSVQPTPAPMMLAGIGGVESQDGRFGDFALFNRRLTHRERHEVESFLQGKFLTSLPPGPDQDTDGMPDAWESSHGLSPLVPNALTDDDNDGATNLQEFQAGLDPRSDDTDRDGLPDGWELRWGTNPLVPDADDDPDGDGLSNLDEFRNGTDPLEADNNPWFLPFRQLRLWWRADHGLPTEEPPTTWKDSSAFRNPARPGEPDSPLPLGETPLAGWKVARLSDTALTSSLPIPADRAGSDRGATATLVLRPPATPETEYRRLFAWGDLSVGVQDNRLVLAAASATLTATASDPLPAQPFVLSCVTSLATARTTLFVDGKEAVSLDNSVPPLNDPLVFGGETAWPADLAEVMVHAGGLAPIDRRAVERVLQGKWMQTGSMAADTDGDGLPDWWEFAAASDAATPDDTEDADWDGTSNRDAFLAARPGFVWLDVDDDAMHDGWEATHGLDPTRNDADEDPDGDGLTNGMEHALLLPPRAFDPVDAWLLLEPPAVDPRAILLRSQANQRSWLRRPHLESTTSFSADAWDLTPAPVTVGRRPGAVSIEETRLSFLTRAARRRQFFRLRLLSE